MDILLNILVSFGLVAVSLCFVILLPVVSKTLIGVFSIVMGEQTFSRFRKVESGSVIRRVDNPPPVEPKPVDDHDHDHHEPAPLNLYLGVYGALLVLTVATVGVSELGLEQKHAVFWAVIVASMKASLVIAWFMHVKGGPAVNKVILTTTGFFMIVFFTLTMADLGTRNFVFEEEGHKEVLREASREGRLPSGWSEQTEAPH